ncbi:OR9I1 isoform 3, partial [Pongo abelii]
LCWSLVVGAYVWGVRSHPAYHVHLHPLLL